MLPHYLEKVRSVFKSDALLCILNCVPIKGSYQTYGGNFTHISADYQDLTDLSVSLWRMSLTQNHMVNQVTFFQWGHFVVHRYL